MAGYDDPRFLQTVIEKLQRDVAKLQKETLPLLSYQRGPAPGWLAAGQVGPGTSTKSAMHLNIDGNLVGQSPRQTVTDANGRIRVEIGNLAAYTDPGGLVSPADYGARVISGTGGLLWDSGQLIRIEPLLGFGSGNGSFTSTTAAVISGTPVTFTVSRTTRIRVAINVTGASATQTGICSLAIGGVLQFGTSETDFGANGPTVTSGVEWSGIFTAGTYTLDLRAAVSNTPATFTVTSASITVYSLGSV